MTPSQTLKEFRRRFILSQGSMAEMFGVKNYQTISHWESGLRPPPVLILRLIRILMWLEKSEAEAILSLMQQDERTPHRSLRI